MNAVRSAGFEVIEDARVLTNTIKDAQSGGISQDEFAKIQALNVELKASFERF